MIAGLLLIDGKYNEEAKIWDTNVIETFYQIDGNIYRLVSTQRVRHELVSVHDGLHINGSANLSLF